ncbi:MAG: DUF5591 domain-containing protein [Thermoplasmata archaeon]
MIEITHRWGLAKKGIWTSENLEVPEVLSVEEKGDLGPFSLSMSHFQESKSDLPAAFGYPEYIGGHLVECKKGDARVQPVFDQTPDPDADVYILGNAPEMMGRADMLVKKVLSLRKNISPHKLIYAPAVASPYNLALLVYMGIDLFDTVYCEYMSTLGVELSDWMGFPGDPNENEKKLRDELELVKKGIEYGRIRELVESRVRAEPWMVESLRLLDRAYDIVSPCVPVSGDKLFACTRESLHRPDIARFRHRIFERYKPPRRSVLLLLPCSASKPYFNSRTHSAIRSSMGGTAWTEVHEVILTSPLGTVPRELELFYPAQNYDIPVSHEWFQDEADMIIEVLNHIVKQGDYEHIVSHLPRDMAFVPEHLECVDTANWDHPTSKRALGRLKDHLIDLVGKQSGSIKDYLNENLSGLARFQFGPGGENLLKGAKVKGRYPNYRFMYKNRQRGMIVAERGMIALTVEGGEILHEKGIYQVGIDDFTPKGTVFAVGVKDADHRIHPHDECILSCGGKLKGVGKAVMSGPEMAAAGRGAAVEVRHHV